MDPLAAVQHACVYIYIYVYIHMYISPDESMGGTHFGGLRVKQRDAPRLNDGRALSSHYKSRGFGFFFGGSN